jgi:bifunctional DNA-binding transcriptional regulator/antitoxin component of YhaV-PrlF toxin-antitoxin module
MSVILELGAKGRAVIPAAVRQEAGVEVGQALIAHAEGAGRIVLETPAAVQARVWAAAPDGDESGDSGRDVRALRAEDNRVAEAAAGRRHAAPVLSEGSADDTGEALLRALGL